MRNFLPLSSFATWQHGKLQVGLFRTGQTVVGIYMQYVYIYIYLHTIVSDWMDADWEYAKLRKQTLVFHSNQTTIFIVWVISAFAKTCVHTYIDIS